MASLREDGVAAALSKVLLVEEVDGLDEDFIRYLAGLLSEGLEDQDVTQEAVHDLMGPFLDSMDCPPHLVEHATRTVVEMAASSRISSSNSNSSSNSTLLWNSSTLTAARPLKQGIVNMSSQQQHQQSEAEVEANRFLWGTDGGVAAVTNKTIDAYSDKSSAKDRRKQKQELEQARREFQVRLEREQESESNSKGVVSTMVLPDYHESGRANEKNVQVQNISLSLDNGRSLLNNGDLKFSHLRRYGLVGPNGVGKTTLLKAMAAMDIEGFPRHLRVLHVRQELTTKAEEIPVIRAVLEADAERNALLDEEQSLLRELERDKEDPAASTMNLQEKRERLLSARAENAEFQEKLKRLDQVYARLHVVGSDTAESRAVMILSGLQFTPEMQAGPTSALSGGWRMRVALAAALFIEPDILMLDEPTNHLDLEAVLWLESYLVNYKHTLIVVSHDRGFLNEVCTDIIEFRKQKLTYYRGNYDTYVKTRDEQIKNDMRVHHAYQDKRAHMMEFIDKFRANAKRATMVQSRIKAVEKMDAEAPEPVEVEQVWRFSIPNPEPLGRPIISVDDVSFDYKPVVDGVKKPESNFLLQKVNFGVDLSSRIGILGANGAGKSTLLNLILGIIQPMCGSVSRNGRLRIGHFTQHSADKFELELSSVENMLKLFPGAGDQEMRSFLGRFQIQGTEALKPMFLLSGGQKSRVAFASLAYQKPHVIIMDEPTNHLDMESIDALVEAIQSYHGGLMVVSHDQYFISNTCRELWVVGGGRALRFRGDFGEYKKHTLEKTRKRVEASVKRLSEMNN